MSIIVNDKIESENYPYGFKLKTSKFDWIEFAGNKGFRHCSQTLNPKTGILNKVKKGVFKDLICLEIDKIGHVSPVIHTTYSASSMNKMNIFISDNFNKFSPEQIKYFIRLGMQRVKAHIRFKMSNGLEPSTIFETTSPYLDTYKRMVENTDLNLFSQIKVNFD